MCVCAYLHLNVFSYLFIYITYKHTSTYKYVSLCCSNSSSRSATNSRCCCWLLERTSDVLVYLRKDLLRHLYVLPHWEIADWTFYLTQAQYTDTGPTSPSTDPISSGAWLGSHSGECQSLSHWYDCRPGKKSPRCKHESNSALETDAFTTRQTRRSQTDAAPAVTAAAAAAAAAAAVVVVVVICLLVA